MKPGLMRLELARFRVRSSPGPNGNRLAIGAEPHEEDDADGGNHQHDGSER